MNQLCPINPHPGGGCVGCGIVCFGGGVFGVFWSGCVVGWGGGFGIVFCFFFVFVVVLFCLFLGFLFLYFLFGFWVLVFYGLFSFFFFCCFV